jgi:hypothetical protein
MMCAVWRPDAVLQAVQAGIDIFDTSYPEAIFSSICDTDTCSFIYVWEKQVIWNTGLCEPPLSSKNCWEKNTLSE